MKKKKCNHFIGIWYDYDNTDIINIDGLKENIKDIKNLNEYRKENGYDKVMGLSTEYTLEDYFNKNKNCDNFDLFNYCPFCGEEIKLDKEQE